MAGIMIFGPRGFFALLLVCITTLVVLFVLLNIFLLLLPVLVLIVLAFVAASFLRKCFSRANKNAPGAKMKKTTMKKDSEVIDAEFRVR